jgi:hypothetical protein
LKIIGCGLILIASIVCAFYYEKRIKEKISRYNELISFINYIKNQIEYFSYPINEIFAKYQDTSLFINSIINNNLDTKYLTNEEKAQIIDFITSLGKGYKKEQIALCEYNIGFFNVSLDKTKYEAPKKIKVFRSMSLFVGICSIILLV